MKPNKLSSRLLALALSLVLSLSLSLPALAAGEDGIIYIHTAKDLCALSDSCAYDAWSRGKTVLLTADISLRGVDFEPIASFSGTFNGGGHTISGLTLTDSLSPAGLFLTLERGAFVHALKVEGQVTPGGTKEFVGGIVGRNYGTLGGVLVLRRRQGRQRRGRHRRPQRGGRAGRQLHGERQRLRQSLHRRHRRL